MINFDVGQGPEQGISNLNALLAALNFWQPSTVVAVGDVVKSHSVTAKSMLYAECTSAGTSGTSEPVWGALGDTINDGTVVWTMRDLRIFKNALTIDGNSYNGSSALSLSTLMFRNKIINGNFAINQRAVSGTVVLAAGQYGHDRWKAGAGGCTYTFATVANVTTITITAGSLIQIIEGINLQSGTHILSWQGTAQGKIGAGDYGASDITGMAVGGTNLVIEFGTGTLSNVQLEQGSVATEFEQRPIGVELQLCQRYYEIISTSDGNRTDGSLGSRYCNTASSFMYVGSACYAVTKRAVPTLTYSTVTYENASNFTLLSSESGYTARCSVTAAGLYRAKGYNVYADAEL